jgi:hypothetical protein
LQDNADYNWVCNQIDLDNFIQYQLTEIYLNNRDWPGNNIKFWNTLADDSKWRWILFDTDFGFGIWNSTDYQANTVEFALYQYGTGWPNPAWSTLFLRRMVSNSGSEIFHPAVLRPAESRFSSFSYFLILILCRRCTIMK